MKHNEDTEEIITRATGYSITGSAPRTSEGDRIIGGWKAMVNRCDELSKKEDMQAVSPHMIKHRRQRLHKRMHDAEEGIGEHGIPLDNASIATGETPHQTRLQAEMNWGAITRTR